MLSSDSSVTLAARIGCVEFILGLERHPKLLGADNLVSDGMTMTAVDV